MKFQKTEQAPKKNRKPRPWEGKHYLYYEAILQLRDVETEQVDYALNILRKEKIPIPKTVEYKNGIDLYTADSKTTKEVAKLLQKKYGGINLVTAKLFSERDGKSIYRLTILYRSPGFKKGDTIIYKGEPFVVKLLQEKIIIQNEKTGKKVQIKCNEKGMSLIKKQIEE